MNGDGGSSGLAAALVTGFFGVNTVSICAELNPAPNFSGDTGDFQIRAIRLIAN